MNRIALAAAGLLLTSGVAVAAPIVAGGSASADQETWCDSNNWMNHDYNTVQRDRARIKLQEEKIRKIRQSKPKGAAAKRKHLQQLEAANKRLRQDKTQLKHDEKMYDDDVPCDPSWTPPGSSSASASPSSSASASGSASASPSGSASASTSTSPSSSSSSGSGGTCAVLPIPVICGLL